MKTMAIAAALATLLTSAAAAGEQEDARRFKEQFERWSPQQRDVICATNEQDLYPDPAEHASAAMRRAKAAGATKHWQNISSASPPRKASPEGPKQVSALCAKSRHGADPTQDALGRQLLTMPGVSRW